MGLWGLAWKNLVRRPWRSALTVLGLSVATATVVALIGVSQRLEQSFLHLYNRRGADLVVQHAGGMMQLNSGINENLHERIGVLPGTGQVIGGLMDVVALERFDMFAVIVNGWRADCPVLDQVKIVEGRRLQSGDRGRVMLGKVLAGNIGKRVGDTIEFYAEQFDIVGIFDSFSVYETGAIFLLLDELQRLMDRPHKVTGYVVQATRPGDVAAVEDLRKRINGLDPNIRAVAVSEFVRNISQIRVIRAGSWVTSIIAVAIGIVGVLNTMITSVFERSSEIGTLRAIGWHKRRVMSMVIAEAVLLSSLAAIVGGTLGAGTVRLLGRLPQLAGFLDGWPPVAVMAQGALLAIVVGVLGALYPAVWAANLWPAQTLRRR
jgi:putative ABC transport system permease protein